ncbi:MAG: hypothetical protein EOP62_00915 [Sphingomonadales bacterium]|nr:MAG: hypothetical protein EOP62_00915 [Sphingomonadales bacterium]
MRQLMIVPALALLLAGCGGRAPEAERNVTTTDSEAEANIAGNQAETGNALASVLALNDAQRNGVFYRALDDAGITCASVDSSERLPDQNGQPLWRANCGGIKSSNHLLSVTPDGTVNIVTRNDR